MQGFENHIKQDHNMWNYIYFSLHLDQIDVRDHDAIEKYIHERVRTQYVYYRVKSYLTGLPAI